MPVARSIVHGFLQKLLAGKTPAQAARAVGVARQTAYTWKALLDEGGIDALRAMPTRGRPARLDDEQLQALGRALLQSPTRHGFGTEIGGKIKTVESAGFVDRVSATENRASGGNCIFERKHCRAATESGPPIVPIIQGRSPILLQPERLLPPGSLRVDEFR